MACSPPGEKYGIQIIQMYKPDLTGYQVGIIPERMKSME
jgi:hypothetical protein